MLGYLLFIFVHEGQLPWQFPKISKVCFRIGRSRMYLHPNIIVNTRLVNNTVIFTLIRFRRGWILLIKHNRLSVTWCSQEFSPWGIGPENDDSHKSEYPPINLPWFVHVIEGVELTTEKVSRKLNHNVPKYVSCPQNQGNFKLFTDLIECGKNAKDKDADTKQEVWEGEG